MDSRPEPPILQIPAYSAEDLTSALPTANHNLNKIQDSGLQKRKQILFTILDALNELTSQEQDHGLLENALVVDEPEGPSTDSQLQSKGVEAFNRFQRRVQKLDKELQNFANAVQQLGSSVRILSSSFHLRQRLLQVFSLFRENAVVLFRRKIPHKRREVDLDEEMERRLKTHARQHRVKLPAARPAVEKGLTLESFPKELRLLATDLSTFLECLNEFPEFTDEAVNTSILEFEGDLKYWASCLKDFEGQFYSKAMRRYLHDLSGEIGDRIENITATISVSVEVGVPTIRFAQKHAATNLLNLTTVATFFSAVTATTIQFSFEKVQGPLQNTVNAFWFSSLVFSIASAVNSLLGLTWKQTVYRSPRHRVSWLVLIWIKRSPLIFLVISVAAFSIGLVLFTWASGQHLVTCIVTTVFTGFSSFGLIAVSTWFALERIIYHRHKGKRWLADILTDLNTDIRKSTGMSWAGEVLPRHTGRARSWSVTQASRCTQAGSAFMHAIVQSLTGTRQKSTAGGAADAERGTSSPAPDLAVPPTESPARRLSDTPSVRPDQQTPRMIATPSELSVPPAELAGGPRRSTSKTSIVQVVRKVMSSTSAPAGVGAAGEPENSSHAQLDRNAASELLTAQKLHWFIMTSRALREVDVAETLKTHQALVRDLQFTPDGSWLATCGWDYTCVIYKVVNGEPLIRHKTLNLDGRVQQVAWAPKGGYLLTRLHSCIEVWTEDGMCVKTIERRERVQSVTWLPNSKEFLSVEGSNVNKIDLTGKVVATYNLRRLALHDVAVTPDEERMLGVATLIESCDGLKPLTARTEKRIVVYKLAGEGKIENQVPVMHNVREITISRDGHCALVSYDGKVPPQLWRLHNAKRDSSNMRLSLLRTYMPNADASFGGPGYFGGKKDELILCVGDNGHIYIWDRESADLLHDLHVPEGDLRVTGIAWNTAFDTPMFATGSHGGLVKIWTSSLQLPNLNAPQSQSLSPSRAESPTSIGNWTPPSIMEGVLRENPVGQSPHRQLSPQSSGRELPGRNRSASASGSVGQLLPETTPSHRSELPGRIRSASTSSSGRLSPETSRREPSGRNRSISDSSTGRNDATRI